MKYIEKQANKIHGTMVGLVVTHRFYLALLFFGSEIYIYLSDLARESSHGKGTYAGDAVVNLFKFIVCK